jgi:hypothetical protein
MARMPKEERLELAVLLITHVNDTYRAVKSGPEPTLTATYLLDYALQHGRCPESLKFATRRRQQSLVRSVLESARRNGSLGSSLGLDALPARRRGRTLPREVRLYEPKKAVR